MSDINALTDGIYESKPAALRHQSRGSEPQSVRLPSFRKALLVVNYKLPARTASFHP